MNRKMVEGHEGLLTVTKLMNTYSIKFKNGVINLLEGFAGCGKSYFMMNDFINNTARYTDFYNEILNFKNRLSVVLWVCDTKMLMDSVINDYPLIAEAKKKGMLIEAKESSKLKKLLSEDNGTIKVISYQTLSLLVKDEKCNNLIKKYISCIIMDEFHQLFNYYYDFKSSNLGLLISKLNSLADKVLIIAMTATRQPVDRYQFNNNNELNISNVLNDRLIEKLDRHFIDSKKYYHCGWNMIRGIDWDNVKKNRLKVLIYTDFISIERKYKEYLETLGFNVEWLCSPTAGNKYPDIDEKTGEIIERFEPTMSDDQMQLREYLIKNNELPADLDILIINSSYQTGWNLKDKDEKIQIVLVDSNREDVHVQAVRVRHDILFCGLKWSNVDKEGRMLYSNGTSKQEYFYEKGQERQWYCDEEGNLKSYDMYVEMPKINLPDKFIGVKISDADKKHIVYNYAFAPAGKSEANWTTVKRDLEKQGYIVDTNNRNGTYIYKAGQEIKKDSKKVMKKMNNFELLKEWLLNEWDRVRIPITEVRDYLDFGRKTWDKVIKSEEFSEFIKTNRIKIKTIPKMGKTLYFTTY